MSIYLRKKSWYYDFVHKGHRDTGSVSPVSRTVAKEEEHRKKTEVLEHRLNPAKARKSPRFDTFAAEYLDWMKANKKDLKVFAVSGGDPYEQGYAAGASAKERNSFNAFDSGYRAGETAQGNAESQAASAQAYNNGYQAGIAQANRDKQDAYNDGYQDRSDWDRSVTARAFNDGVNAGAYRQARNDAEYP